MMHGKQAVVDGNRAPMIRYRSQKQLTLAEFDWPFQVALDESNRWVELSQCIPWDEMAEGYYRGMSKDKGHTRKGDALQAQHTRDSVWWREKPVCALQGRVAQVISQRLRIYGAKKASMALRIKRRF